MNSACPHPRRAGMRLPCALRPAAALAAIALGAPVASLAQGTGPLLYQGMTLPSGLVRIANDYWVADHLSGFCRLVAGNPGFLDQSSCNLSQTSPGQAAVKEVLLNPNDPASAVAYAYVPDNSSKGQGVWRHTIKDGFVLNSFLLPNAGINGNRPMAVALGPDGHLYVSLGRNNNILRIKNPDPASDQTGAQVVEKVGTSALKVGPPALAFAGNTLYLAENTGLTSLGAGSNNDATSCAGACTARALNAGVAAPVFVTGGGGVLFLANLTGTYRYTPPAAGIPGCLKPLGSGYGGVAALAYDPASGAGPASLYVGDDPTAGASIFRGVVYGGAADSNASCTAAGGGGGGGGGGATPPPSPTSPVTLSGPATGATLPAAIVQVGAATWIADHLQGFCRLGPAGLDQCVANAARAPGQAVAVPASLNGAAVTQIYVPDTSSKGLGVWRLTHNGSAIVSSTLLAPGKLAGARTTAVAYGPDNKLYVVSGKDNRVLRIANPEGAPADVEQIGFVSGRAGPLSMSFMGNDLYFAEATGITVIPSAANCRSNALCTARSFATPVAAPVFVTSDNTYLYIADLNKAYRFTPAGPLTSGGIAELGTGFASISALGINLQPPPAGATGTVVRSLLVGDDTTAGTLNGTGRVWNLNLSRLTP